MTAHDQLSAMKRESDRLLDSGFSKASGDSAAQLTHEQQWDIENEHKFDPAIFHEIQQETEQWPI